MVYNADPVKTETKAETKAETKVTGTKLGETSEDDCG